MTQHGKMHNAGARKKALVIFTRALENDSVKSRLAGVLSPAQRHTLHQAFLADLKALIDDDVVDKTGCELVLCSTTPSIPQELACIFGDNCLYIQQRGDSFKRRLSAAFEDVMAAGYESVVLLGSDCVETSPESLVRAFALLEFYQLVLGPSTDGGFYLAGASGISPRVFEIDGYGTPNALSALERAAQDSGANTTRLRRCGDMDTLFDLQMLAYRAREANPGYLPCHTLAALKEFAEQGADTLERPISLIVCTYNEASTAQRLTRQLNALNGQCEIVIADGGSTDGTREMLGADFKVIDCPKGRGRQLNRGVAASHGDILFFIHADSILPPDALAQIREVMRSYRAGCFGITFPRSTIAMACCQRLSNFRARRRKVMFGDQGIFIERALFAELGGFREIALMEDYQLSLDLAQRRIAYGMCKQRIQTSDRRYTGGMLHQLVVMRQMAKLRKRYRNGEDPETLAREYRDLR